MLFQGLLCLWFSLYCLQFIEAAGDGRRGLKIRLGQRIEVQVTWKEVQMLQKYDDSKIGGFSCSTQNYDECSRKILKGGIGSDAVIGDLADA